MFKWSWAALDNTDIRQPLLSRFMYLQSRSSDERILVMSSLAHRLDIHILDISVTPKNVGDVFGQIASAFLKVKCTGIKILPTFRTRWSTGFLELCNGSERINFHLDLEFSGEMLLDNVYLLRVVTFVAPFLVTSIDMGQKNSGIAGLLLQRSPDSTEQFQRIGIFYLDRYQEVDTDWKYDNVRLGGWRLSDTETDTTRLPRQASNNLRRKKLSLICLTLECISQSLP